MEGMPLGRGRGWKDIERVAACRLFWSRVFGVRAQARRVVAWNMLVVGFDRSLHGWIDVMV